ncbi:MAG: PIN domain-containing protein [Humibacillus sp.]|nr:PIN domain-containing protein [Humibacillus sp.]MDN5780039.1 PIN domain-containing protein [Humibacillus sp.]
MTAERDEARVPFRVVLGDANILYSRVLRDYLLYAMTRRVVRVHWSAAILDEVVEHLSQNIDGFTVESGRRLVTAMNGAFPNAEVAPTADDLRTVAELALPDEDDRHVLAAAVAAEADVLCTDNIKHFPPDAMATIGIEALTADELLTILVEDFGDDLLAAHRLTVSRLPGATNESTIAALRRANVSHAADLIAALLSRS